MAGLLHKEATHRAVPWPVARRLVLAVADRAWAREAKLRDDARWQMRYLVGKTDRAAEVETLAREYVRATYLRLEGMWRPWRVNRHGPTNLEVLVRARRRGRGVLINFLHHGDYVARIASLGRAGFRVHVPAWGGVADPNGAYDQTGYYRTARTQTFRALTRAGASVFGAAGSSEKIRALLADGEIVMLASDLPSKSVVTVLGRQGGMSLGAARLSLETGAPIVPLVGHRREGAVEDMLLDPVEPAHFSDPLALLQEVIRRHEPALLSWPPGLERPLRRWSVTPADEAEFGAVARSSLRI